VAADFFVVPTATYRPWCSSPTIGDASKHVAVTAHPAAAWTAQQLREAFPYRVLLADIDKRLQPADPAHLALARSRQVRIRSCSTTINRETSARTSGSIGLVQDSIGREVRPRRRRRVRPLSPRCKAPRGSSASEGCPSRTHSSDRSKTVSTAGGHQRARLLASGTVGIRRRSQRRPR
jgi:hypothetical protein